MHNANSGYRISFPMPGPHPFEGISIKFLNIDISKVFIDLAASGPSSILTCVSSSDSFRQSACPARSRLPAIADRSRQNDATASCRYYGKYRRGPWPRIILEGPLSFDRRCQLFTSFSPVSVTNDLYSTFFRNKWRRRTLFFLGPSQAISRA